MRTSIVAAGAILAVTASLWAGFAPPTHAQEAARVLRQIPAGQAFCPEATVEIAGIRIRLGDCIRFLVRRDQSGVGLVLQRADRPREPEERRSAVDDCALARATLQNPNLLHEIGQEMGRIPLPLIPGVRLGERTVGAQLLQIGLRRVLRILGIPELSRVDIPVIGQLRARERPRTGEALRAYRRCMREQLPEGPPSSRD